MSGFQPLGYRGRPNKLTGLPSSLIVSTAGESSSRLTIRQMTSPHVAVEKKVLWGQPIWFLFHTLAEKVLLDSFASVSQGLLQLIYSISTNLPCPTCTSHAKEYLDKINFNAIQSKDQLKQMLHKFHNTVNEKKGYPFFSYEETNEKYSKAITVNIIHNFISQFEKKNKSIRLIADDLHRQGMTRKLRTWFNDNISHFAA